VNRQVGIRDSRLFSALREVRLALLALISFIACGMERVSRGEVALLFFLH
jgi:hypothetical protein